MWLRVALFAFALLAGTLVFSGVSAAVWELLWGREFVEKNLHTPFIWVISAWSVLWALACGYAGWRMGLGAKRFFICGLGWWELVVPALLIYRFIKLDGKGKIYNNCALVLAWFFCAKYVAELLLLASEM